MRDLVRYAYASVLFALDELASWRARRRRAKREREATARRIAFVGQSLDENGRRYWR